jgi:hypothetical protein
MSGSPLRYSICNLKNDYLFNSFYVLHRHSREEATIKHHNYRNRSRNPRSLSLSFSLSRIRRAKRANLAVLAIINLFIKIYHDNPAASLLRRDEDERSSRGMIKRV